MSKETTTVRVAGKEYTLTSSDGAEHLERQHWPRKIAGFLRRKFRG